MEGGRPTDGDAEAHTRKENGVDESEVADVGREGDVVVVVVVGGVAAAGRELDRVTYCKNWRPAFAVSLHCQGNCCCYAGYHYCCYVHCYYPYPHCCCCCYYCDEYYYYYYYYCTAQTQAPGE